MEDTEIRRRPGGRTARVRGAIVDATLAVLAEQGLDGLTVNEVAKRAEVNPVSIYRHWGTREKLVLDALLRQSRERLPIPDTGTLHGDLTEFATHVIAFLHSPFGQATARAMLVAGEEARATQVEFWTARSEAAGVMVTRAVRRGEIPPSADARLVLEMLVSPLHFRALLSPEPIDPAVAGQLAATIVHGLRE
ncbi:TetR/AcrR family transcriptional regulator [Nocardia inohanensis]|uniref:TetR/AcrR family transcriptional regulator n=1 Tax=Nocardia inohanensis TaxID=209246 RepID=UPI001C3F9C99|nr:TetR/AcrR family transcriptional regulator [Nocardia inohanensis]